MNETIYKCTLQWHAGPANNGTGTAGKDSYGNNLWWDGDLLFIVVDTTDGRTAATVRIHADQDQLEMTEPIDGNVISAWPLDAIAWWAKVKDLDLPPGGEEQLSLLIQAKQAELDILTEAIHGDGQEEDLHRKLDLLKSELLKLEGKMGKVT